MNEEAKRFKPNTGHLKDMANANLIRTGEDSIDSPTLQLRIATQLQLEAAFLALYQEIGTKAIGVWVIPDEIAALPEKITLASTPEQLLKIAKSIPETFDLLDNAVRDTEVIMEFVDDLKAFVAESGGTFSISDKVSEYLSTISTNYNLIESYLLNNENTLKAALDQALELAKAKATDFLNQSEE
jgi:hypothetical protein